MEVVHRRMEEDVMVVVEEQLRTRRRRPDFADHNGGDVTNAGDEMDDEFEVHKNGVSPKSVVYFEKNEGMWKCQHCIWTHKIGQYHWIHLLHQESFRGNILQAGKESDISKHVNDIINHQNDVVGDMKDGTLSISNVIVEVVDESGDEEEDVIELEFEKAVHKLHTHTPYCPNCRNQITKVILRRKKRRQSDLLGCFNCFAIFIPSGGRLNPFGFLKSKPKLQGTKVEDVQPSIYGEGTTTNAAEPQSPKVEDVQPSTEVGHESTTSNAAAWSLYNLFSINGKREKNDQNEEIVERKDQDGEAKPEINPTHDVTIDIEAGTGGRPQTNIHEHGELEQPLISGNIQRSTSFEILKCIVYGGLIESITSLSIVSSAVASDIPTLNVVAIGLASMFSGLIIFGCNLLELRDETTPDEKYQELLGRRGHFLLHSTFAVFSYLLCGLIAPITYGFAFRESDNKDYKIITVAAAAFACIFILSIAKAYVIETEKFVGYVKTTLYYVTVAVGASGLAYAAGDLFGMLLHDFGWFQSAREVTPPAWVSY